MRKRPYSKVVAAVAAVAASSGAESDRYRTRSMSSTASVYLAQNWRYLAR